MTRRIVIKTRVPLGPYSDGWDDCFLIFTAISKADQDSINESTDFSNAEAESFIDDILTSHFIRGKIRVTDEEDKEVLVDADTSDLAQLPRALKFSVFSYLATGGAQYRNPKV